MITGTDTVRPAASSLGRCPSRSRISWMQVTAIFIGCSARWRSSASARTKSASIVDVDGLQRVDLEEDRALADAPPGGDLLGGEQVEVGVLLVDRRQVLGPQQHVGIVVDRRPVGAVQPRLPAGHREQRVVVVERRAPSGRGRRRSSRAAAAGSSCASADTTPTAPARRRSAARRSSACGRRAGARGGRSPSTDGKASAACSLTVGLSVSMTTRVIRSTASSVDTMRWNSGTPLNGR